MVAGSLELKTSPTASRDGGGHFGFFTVSSPAAAAELLTLSHVLYVHGEEARLRVNWATDQRNLPPSAPPPLSAPPSPPGEDVPIKTEPGTEAAAPAYRSMSAAADEAEEPRLNACSAGASCYSAGGSEMEQRVLEEEDERALEKLEAIANGFDAAGDLYHAAVARELRARFLEPEM